jgi:hypothetical protein
MVYVEGYAALAFVVDAWSRHRDMELPVRSFGINEGRVREEAFMRDRGG